MVAFNENSCYGHNYKATTKSCPYFMDQISRESVGEFFSAQVHAYFTDSSGIMILVESDKSRYYEQLWTSEPSNNLTDFPLDAQRKFRHSFESVAQEGLIGSFFIITIQKVIPDDGEYQLFGSDLNIIPTTEYTAEFESGFGPIAEGW